MAGNDPTVLRRRLRVELKRARTEAKLTQREVADALDWSPSKIIRIENGSVSISTTDLHALLAHYGVHDKRVVEELVGMARGSKKQQAWHQYRDVYEPAAIQYFVYEGAASIIRDFGTLLVPGLLQTEEYARAVLKDVYQVEAAKIDRMVEARLTRQELFERDDPPAVFFILDEAAIRRAVGGASVMRRQLEHLMALGSRPKVTIQIVPFAFGAHTGMRGPFVYLEFPDPDDDDVLYLEDTLGDQVFRDEPEVTGDYLRAFWDLENIASAKADLGGYVQHAIDKLTGDSENPGRSPAEPAS
jgi:transcriptional regulator with XRE-family HTH domain